jgi:hypothetical protein
MLVLLYYMSCFRHIYILYIIRIFYFIVPLTTLLFTFLDYFYIHQVFQPNMDCLNVK